MMKKTKSKKGQKFRYDVRVIETVESSAVIESDVRIPWDKLVKIAEQRRLEGTLSLCGVTAVEMYPKSVIQDN